MPKFIPPYLFLICVLLMIGLNRLIPAYQVVPENYSFLGYIVLVIGLLMIIKIGRTFKERDTQISPYGKPRKLVTDGLFRYTRNPIYVGFTVALLGIWLILGSLTPIAAIVIFVVVIHNFFIPMEETNMEKAFGKDYLEYKSRVRRWI